MSGFFRALFAVPHGFFLLLRKKIFRFKRVKFGTLPRIDFITEVTVEGSLTIGKKFNMRRGSVLRVRKKGRIVIGDNVSFGLNNVIVCLESIKIGNGCEFGANVQIYDHDHDFRLPGGISENQYKTSSIVVGENCWIGSNVVILRGARIGKNSVIGAGCIIKCDVPDDCVVVQKRETTISKINKEQV